MTMHSLARRTAVGAAIFTLAACSSGTTASSGATTSSTTSTMTATTSAANSAGPTGGAPGISPTRMPAGETPSAGVSAGGVSASGMSSGMDAGHNDADIAFAQQMIPHHLGAVQMADLAPTRATSQGVKDLAIKIKAAQAPEIDQMTSWLKVWGADVGTDMNGMPNSTATPSSTATGDMGGMNHGGMNGSDSSSTTAMGSQMPGMMTADEMSQLTAANGATFDKLFLQLMITHHQGAVQMADTELAQGNNRDALALATSIKTSQTAEIAQMQQLLQTL